MDCHSIHGHDVASFTTTETHRLPTVSASQALDELHSSQHIGSISTGLNDLDQALLGSSSESQEPAPLGGVKQGQVTEIWGPPGAGKTALGIQLSANAICDGGSVVWVDCFHAPQTERLNEVLDAVKKSRDHRDNGSTQHGELGLLTYYACLTLPHLMALISRPTKDLIAQNVSLVVISMATALLNSALPKSQDSKSLDQRNKGSKMPPKRLQALQFIINALQKLAATRNCAVVLLSQCATKMQSERGAALTPAVNATVWEQGVSTRIVVYRDWARQGDKLVSVLMSGVQKLDGKANEEYAEHAAVFQVEKAGVVDVQYDTVGMANIIQQKRKLEQTDLEEPGREDDDEDYDWANEDGTSWPFSRGKWQGSEDFLGQDAGRSDEEPETDEEDGEQSPSKPARTGADEELSAGETPKLAAETP